MGLDIFGKSPNVSGVNLDSKVVRINFRSDPGPKYPFPPVKGSIESLYDKYNIIMYGMLARTVFQP